MAMGSGGLNSPSRGASQYEEEPGGTERDRSVAASSLPSNWSCRCRCISGFRGERSMCCWWCGMMILGVPTADKEGDNDVGVSCGSGDCTHGNCCCGCSFLIVLVVLTGGLLSLLRFRVSCRCLV